MTEEPIKDETKANEEDWRLDVPRAWYFDGSNRFIKTLRFFNLMELGKPVISWSKLMLAVAFILLTVATGNYIFTLDPNGLEKVLAAAAPFFLNLLNYGYRRYTNYLKFVRKQDLDD